MSITAAQTTRSFVCCETLRLKLLIVGVRYAVRSIGRLVSGGVAAHILADGRINKTQEPVFPTEKLGIVRSSSA